MRRLAPIIETPDEPIDGSLLWIDSTNMEKPSAKIKHANRWISIVGERGEKGEKGDAPKITSDNDGVLYSEGKLLTEVVKDAAIKAIEAADKANEASDNIQDELDQKVDVSKLVLISDVEYQKLIDSDEIDSDKIYFVYEGE